MRRRRARSLQAPLQHFGEEGRARILELQAHAVRPPSRKRSVSSASGATVMALPRFPGSRRTPSRAPGGRRRRQQKSSHPARRSRLTAPASAPAATAERAQLRIVDGAQSDDRGDRQRDPALTDRDGDEAASLGGRSGPQQAGGVDHRCRHTPDHRQAGDDGRRALDALERQGTHRLDDRGDRQRAGHRLDLENQAGPGSGLVLRRSCSTTASPFRSYPDLPPAVD